MIVAVLQSHPLSGTSKGALDVLTRAARSAVQQGARLLVTPEMFLSGYAIGRDAMAAAAARADADWAAVGALAHELGIAMVVGGPVATPDGVLNSARLYDREGGLIADYAKTHLFGTLDREQFAPGRGLIAPVDLDGTRIGIAICYDIEFPETARALTLAGADLIAVPTANMEPYASVCTRLVPARAEENTTPVAYANYVGRESDLTYCGLSVIAGADGEDLARAGASGSALIVAEISAEATAAARRRTPYLADRLPDLYATASALGAGA
ncbi:MAG: nitrilase-related carbon-nitrogen hydrolase [Pseudomonadota bacterium]